MARQYFLNALYVDLADLHGNTVDGLHVASTGGVWAVLVNGFGGMRDHGGGLAFDPRLPVGWDSLCFPLIWRGTRIRVTLTPTALTLEADEGDDVPVTVRGVEHVVGPDRPVVVTLDGHGVSLRAELDDKPQVGGTRPDGTLITAGVPESVHSSDTAEIPRVEVLLPDP